ncbi:MAG: hypothetical protein ACE5HI_14775 [bacterium]
MIHYDDNDFPIYEMAYADEVEIEGLCNPRFLERNGYEKARQHPKWSTLWLMMNPSIEIVCDIGINSTSNRGKS